MKKQEADTASEEAPSVLSDLAFLALTTRCHNFAARSQQPANCYSLSGEYLGRSKLLLVAHCFFLKKSKATLLLLVPLVDIAANKHGAEFIAIRLNQPEPFISIRTQDALPFSLFGDLAVFEMFSEI